MRDLALRIESRDLTLGVIGLGYVGVPVAASFANAGFRVIGVDLIETRVAQINRGVCPIEGDEPGLAALVASVMKDRGAHSGWLRATTEYRELREADIVLIDVETPVGADHRPRFEALHLACMNLGPHLKDRALVIVESTVSPGTTTGMVAALLREHSGRELGVDFFLGHCPERVMPGKLLKNLTELSRVCGGADSETATAMIALYRTIVKGDLDAADCVTAELTKTAENAFRDVNIAFANEVALVCEAAGADFLRVRELVNKSPGRAMLMAGAGVGGHCIPKDPWLLVHGVDPERVRVIPAARETNERMPLHAAHLVSDALEEMHIDMRGARIVVLGYAYLENTVDAHNSPSAALVMRLKEWGAEVIVHDPWIDELKGDLWETLRGAHAAILMVAHDQYTKLDLTKLKSTLRTPILVDGRQVISRYAAKQAGLVFRGLGRGRG